MGRNTLLLPENLSSPEEHSELDNILESLKSGATEINVYGLKGSSREYLVSEISNRLDRQVLYICETGNDRLNITSSNLSYYAGKEIPSLSRKIMDRKQSLFPTHLEEHNQRMDFLNNSHSRSILCADEHAVYERFAPSAILRKHNIHISVGQEVNRDELIDSLLKSGYRKNDIVEKPSDYSVRGAVIDIFPPTASNPFRIEFIGDEVKSIRSFSVSSQTSIEKTGEITITPVTEIIFDEDNNAPVAELLHTRALESDISAQIKHEIIEKIGKAERIPNIEWLVPFVYKTPETLFSYLDRDCVIVIDSARDIKEIHHSIKEHFSEEIKSAGIIEKFLPSVEDLYMDAEEVISCMNQHQIVRVHDHVLNKNADNSFVLNTREIPFVGDTSKDSPLKAFIKRLRELKKEQYSITLVSINDRENEKFRQILSDYSLSGIELDTGPLTTGFISVDEKRAIITENDISTKKSRKPLNAFDSVSSTFIKKFSELKPGDYIVHKECGVGIFRGMTRMKVRNSESDFIICEYQGGDKIFVPVENLKLIQRYIGDNNRPRIDKLGSDTWKKTVRKVKKAVDAVARELLELYAKRSIQKGYSYSPRDQMFREFELGFPYEETDDQAKAIEEVLGDMESDKPMDRLICGDVGFGKTEVALRAAFKATMDGKQVAFIVPTTLLAHQHYETSLKRLSGYPVNIDTLSRFRSGREEKEILKKLESGSIDIIIGTHKLLGNRVKFKNLGLVIIDEEHKFGVKQKEKLRSLKEGLDVLTLSATPIPRTLQFSLSNIRDISLINSPPEGRQAVEVSVCNFDDETIRYAVNQELKRGGSVFFINNRIESIYKVADHLKKIVPEASAAVTHGSMDQRVLENTIEKFMNGEIDILVTTAIVESGLDITRANTIIVKDAHMFGIADLYQLKGRVGRGSVKAYAYFLIPGINSLTPEARKRLVRISELTDLGSGFKLSLSDLEIRGAGNLFGEAQSGHIANVGLEFYLEMLNKAIAQIKNDGSEPEFDPEIKTASHFYIPEEYISDSSERLYYYKRISSVSTEMELSDLRDEINDRFGEIPGQLSGLFDMVDIKIFLKKYKVRKADIKKDNALIVFAENSPYFGKFAPSGKFRVYYEPRHGYSIIKSRMKQLISANH